MRFFFGLMLSLSIYANTFPEAIEKTRLDIVKTRSEMDKQSGEISADRQKMQQELSKIRLELKELKIKKKLLDVEHLEAKNVQLKQEEELAYLNKTLSFMDDTLLEFRRSFETRLSAEQLMHYAETFDEVDKKLHGEDLKQALVSILGLASTHCDSQLGGQRFKAHAIDSNNNKLEGNCVQLGPLTYFSSVDKKNQGLLIQEKNLKNSRLYDNFDPQEKAGIEALIENGEGLVAIDSTMGTAIKLREIDESLLDKMAKGGLTMYPLLALALFCMIVGIYKLISIHLYKVHKTENKVNEILDALKSDNESEALSICEKLGLPLGPVIKVGIKHRNAPREHI